MAGFWPLLAAYLLVATLRQRALVRGRRLASRLARAALPIWPRSSIVAGRTPVAVITRLRAVSSRTVKLMRSTVRVDAGVVGGVDADADQGLVDAQQGVDLLVDVVGPV